MPISRHRKKNKMPQNQNVQKGGNTNSQISFQKAELKHYSGIIPSPEMMEHYERIQPGFANRILIMAEEEGADRRENTKKIIRGSLINERMSMMFALISVLVVGYLAYLCIIGGAYGYASAIVCTVMVGVIGAFMFKRSANKSPKDK
jgi:uncharacterized membrane protein